MDVWVTEGRVNLTRLFVVPVFIRCPLSSIEVSKKKRIKKLVGKD